MKVDNCWANIDKKEGGLNSKVNIYFDENDTGANRSVKIRVSSRDGSVSEECTVVHKKKEQVVYRNKRQSTLFTKEGCNSETEKGEELEYVVEAGKYTSIISQSDADDKAMKDIEQNGQNWVNEHGRCITILWYNVKKSKSFRKNDCDPDTEEGSLVTMTIEAGQFSSTISQEDADRKAEAELNAKGQDYANSHGTCNTIKWYNDRKSKMFQKTDCEVTEVGSMVEYVVEAGRFSSSVSKEDANQKALEALEAEGPGYANEHGTCETNLWYNVEKSKVFYKNDCEDGFIGAPYTYTVEAGKYTSDVSQEDADQKALDDIEKNGQDQANLNGECVTDPNYFVGKASARVQKNDCDAESQTGSFVDLTEKDLAGYPDAFVSRESQEAANALAQAAMEEQKQDLANKKGTCIDKNQFVGVYSKVFTKDNCDGEGVGSQVTVDQDDVTGGPFTSYESQEAANALAQAAVEQQGQAIANRDGHCTWTGKYSEEFTKNDCNEGQVGSKITVTEQDVVGAPFTSTVSQDDANNKAKAAVKEQGQAIANSKGNCENMTVYTGHYSKRFVPECEACHKGVEMEVTAEMVNGSPVTSTESQDAADAEARRIVEEGGQAYVNKNGNCTPLSTDPVWEDVVPEELRCNEGKSQKKQHDTNECSETHNQERWVDGGNKVCSWTGHYSETFQKNDCEIPDSGTEVEVSEADVEGNPFTSFVSQEDADNKAKEAVKAQGQAIANQKGKCRFVGVYSKQFTKDNCGSCHHGVPMSVTQDMVGGPFYSNESQEEANRLAQEAVEAQGQAYVNKNGTCEMDNTDPVWVDSEPLETKCEGGKSYKKQVNTNECYGGADERWVEGGDKVCTWTGTYSKQFTKQCADGGVGSEVTIDQDDVTGGPFTSTVSQEDANSKAQAAVEAQGQALADAQGTCTWTGKASKVFTRNNCGSCQHGSSVTVTQDQVGGPFTSNISQADANKKAQDAVNSQGQAVANKNADCLPDSTTPSWSDTGSTRCDGCTSQKQQRDTNPCSSSYNDTRWVNGGGESCTDWSYYGTGDCVGHTQYNAYRDSCSGSIDRQYSVSCRNCCNCGSYGSWQENGCNGTKTKFIRYDDCGNSDTKEEYVIGSCGYAPYEFQFHDGRTSKSRSVTGESQDIEEVIISTKNDSYIGYSVKSKPSWCSVDYRDQTSESMKAVVTLSANTTSSSRSGDIVFVQNESGKTVTLSITQDVAVTYEFSTNQSTWNADANGGANNSYLCIQLKSKKNGSKIGYTVSSKPSWVTEVTEKPSGVSCLVLSGYDYSFVIISSANSSSSPRSGTVTLKQNESGKTVNITVNQEGKAEVKPVPAHIVLKNGSWATYRRDNVSYNPGAGKCIAGFEWTGDENGNIRIYTCDIKVVDADYREISRATISIGTTTQRKQSGSSCSYFGAVMGGILAGYVHSGDENGDTTWYIRTINVSYEGKVYKTATVRQYEKQNISKKGGVFNVYNESPASYNFIVDGAECGDENGTLKYAYSQMDLNPA
ncbi:carbohydrate-binding protein [phage csAssE-Sib]|nr:carbohydrate-binding protein [phage csAssE-Sib]